MIMEFRVERFRWWHITEVMPLEEELFGPEKWSEWMFWNELAGGHFYRVALAGDGSIAGYGGLAVTSSDEAWVQNLAVRRDVQRRGLGRILLQVLLGEAARQDVRRVLLEVAVDNAPAQKLYAREGFEPVGVRRGYYQPSNTDALVMTREEKRS
jgi:ribosomal-protein-alanine N-acetyltransferase